MRKHSPGRASKRGGAMSDDLDVLTQQLGSALTALIREIVNRAQDDHLGQPPLEHRLLTAEQVAERMWLTVAQVRSKRLPFAVKLGHRTIRYSEHGLEKFLAGGALAPRVL